MHNQIYIKQLYSASEGENTPQIMKGFYRMFAHAVKIASKRESFNLSDMYVAHKNNYAFISVSSLNQAIRSAFWVVDFSGVFDSGRQLDSTALPIENSKVTSSKDVIKAFEESFHYAASLSKYPALDTFVYHILCAMRDGEFGVDLKVDLLSFDGISKASECPKNLLSEVKDAQSSSLVLQCIMGADRS